MSPPPPPARSAFSLTTPEGALVAKFTHGSAYRDDPAGQLNRPPSSYPATRTQPRPLPGMHGTETPCIPATGRVTASGAATAFRHPGQHPLTFHSFFVRIFRL